MGGTTTLAVEWCMAWALVFIDWHDTLKRSNVIQNGPQLTSVLSLYVVVCVCVVMFLLLCPLLARRLSFCWWGLVRSFADPCLWTEKSIRYCLTLQPVREPLSRVSRYDIDDSTRYCMGKKEKLRQFSPEHTQGTNRAVPLLSSQLSSSRSALPRFLGESLSHVSFVSCW